MYRTIKKILTTKPHLVVFFLGILCWPLNYQVWMQLGTKNLNRTIGWGWDISNFVYWIMPASVVSILFFSLIYWILSIKKYEFNFILMFLQVIVIVAILVSIFQFAYFVGEFFLVINWMLFLANIIAALFFGKNRRGKSLG